MSLRFFSVAILVCTSLFSSHTFAALKQYNFPNNSAFSHVFNSRDAAGCPTGVGGTAVYPNHAATGERLCDQEALRQGINPAYMIWYASPVFGTWDSPGDNRLCKYNGSQMQLVNGTQSGGKWTNVVVCEYKPFDCGVRWSYQLQRAGLDWQLNWTRINA